MISKTDFNTVLAEPKLHDSAIASDLPRSESRQTIVKSQLEFYRKNRAGCGFAAVAARNPSRYGWTFKVLKPISSDIDDEIEKLIVASDTSTASLLFPSVCTESDFCHFLAEVQRCNKVIVEQDEVYKGFRCLGFRVIVGELKSWATGFGNFAFLPVTRRAPCVELTFRVKPRPNYKEVMKASPPGVIHLADMNMLGMVDAHFRFLWKKTLQRTAAMLGHPPDLRSAAKTTFAIPEGLL